MLRIVDVQITFLTRRNNNNKILTITLIRKMERKINSHLFWLNSHPFFVSWSRNTADLQALKTRQAQPAFEFNQKGCEFKIFQKKSIVMEKKNTTKCARPPTTLFPI